MTARNLPALLPLLFLGGALLIFFLGMWKRKTAYWATLALLATGFSISVHGFQMVLKHGTVRYFFGGWAPPVGIEFYYDALAAFLLLIVNAVALVVLFNAQLSVAAELKGRETFYYTTVMLLLCGLNGIVLTGDFFNLYVFIEISSLAAYGLIAAGEKQAPFAAFRYLILGTIGGSFYLIGVGFMYFSTGSLNMVDIAAILPRMSESPAVIVALTLMVTGIGIKTALFPLHSWLPDAYTYAPSVSSSLMAPIATKTGVYILARILFFVYGVEFFAEKLPLAQLIALFSCAGIIYGSVMAIAQTELKRMLAYSSIAQIGYIGLGVGLANPLGYIGALLHLMNHAVMKACLFLVAGHLRIRTGTTEFCAFPGSGRRHFPWTLAAFTLAALSMVGIPPLAGFFSKWYIVLAAIEKGSWGYLAVILLGSLLTAVYFFRVLEIFYLQSPTRTEKASIVDYAKVPGNSEGYAILVPVLTMAGGLILLGVFNATIVAAIRQMLPLGME